MGFINVSPGIDKYVFTQATAPSGEGEVEGSLWYDTTANLLYTYSGSAWEKVAATGAMVLIDTQTLTSTAQEFDFTSLDINTDGHYLMIVNLENSETATEQISLFCNGDETATNYYYQRVLINNTAIDSNRTNRSRAVTMVSNGVCCSKINIWLDADGKMRTTSSHVYSETSTIMGESLFGYHNSAQANITQLTLKHDDANGFAVGSSVSLYKVSP